MKAQHDLGCAIPSGGNIFRHVACVLFWVHREASCQTKITNFQLTVRVDQEIARLQVSMEDIGRVDVFETTQDLINEGLEVSVGKRLTRPDDSSQVAFHELCHRSEKDVLIAPSARTLVDICLVEALRSRDVHVKQASDLYLLSIF